MQTFEDSVIFVLDMERSLGLLPEFEQQVITRIVFQGHSHDSAARLFGCTRKSITRHLCVALDHLSERMLARNLLQPF
jgi:DNA-directed RNA polymerase specialized sigma24 family protein